MVATTLNQTLSDEVEHTPHSPVLDILPGLSGAGARVLVGQAFDTIRTRMQVMGAGTLLSSKLPPSDFYLRPKDCLAKMVRNEGWASLYRGTGAAMLGNMALLGIHYPVYSTVRQQLDSWYPSQQLQHLKVLAAGATGGLVGALVSCPTEHVRTKMQLQRQAVLADRLRLPGLHGLEIYKGSLDCAARVLRAHGVKGLYRGFTATALRDMQGYAWFFCVYDVMLHRLSGPEVGYLQVMAAGVAAGLALWTSMYPLDTLKAKMQADSLPHPQYANTYSCYKKSVLLEGRRGLWRGYTAALYRVVPVNVAIFLSVEATRSAIARYEASLRKGHLAQQQQQSRAATL